MESVKKRKKKKDRQKCTGDHATNRGILHVCIGEEILENSTLQG